MDAGAAAIVTFFRRENHAGSRFRRSENQTAEMSPYATSRQLRGLGQQLHIPESMSVESPYEGSCLASPGRLRSHDLLRAWTERFAILYRHRLPFLTT